MNEWISVKDRSPETDEWILIYVHMHGAPVPPDYEILTGRLCGETWEWCALTVGFYKNHKNGAKIGFPFSVTHWMPLPEPPK